jgi:hypothetical protein
VKINSLERSKITTLWRMKRVIGRVKNVNNDKPLGILMKDR